jgi:hypothetical protein
MNRKTRLRQSHQLLRFQDGSEEKVMLSLVEYFVSSTERIVFVGMALGIQIDL